MTIPSPIANTSLLLNFNNSGIYDASGRTVFESVGDARVAHNIAKYGTGSLFLDGTNDYLKSPGPLNLGTGDFTLECWWYPINDNTQEAVFIKIGDHTTTSGIALCTDNSRGFFVYSGGGYTTSGNPAGAYPTTNAWNHLAVTRASGTLRTFVNGVLVESASYTSNLSSGTAGIIIGAFADNTYDAHGYLDDVRITQGYARYTATFTAPTTEFLAR